MRTTRLKAKDVYISRGMALVRLLFRVLGLLLTTSHRYMVRVYSRKCLNLRLTYRQGLWRV